MSNPTASAPSTADIRAALVEQRRRLGRTQREVGAQLGHGSNSNVSQWESGVVEPMLGNLVAWAAALGLRLTVVPIEDPGGGHAR